MHVSEQVAKEGLLDRVDGDLLEDAPRLRAVLLADVDEVGEPGLKPWRPGG